MQALKKASNAEHWTQEKRGALEPGNLVNQEKEKRAKYTARLLSVHVCLRHSKKFYLGDKPAFTDPSLS